MDANEWVASADAKRPWRAEVRAAIARVLSVRTPAPRRALELGAGPGLLAEAILRICALDDYTLFDFSQPMLDMSRRRVGHHATVSFLQGDFKRPTWTEDLRRDFDAVVAMQSIHEIRHKRHVPALYRQIHDLLRPGGVLVVCDHVPPSDESRLASLHSTEAEQHAAFAAAGFVDVTTHFVLKGLYVCSGERAAGMTESPAPGAGNR
jgi:ubiquinone/menaquinone biosynthesis C-methylase UbiE